MIYKAVHIALAKIAEAEIVEEEIEGLSARNMTRLTEQYFFVQIVVRRAYFGEKRRNV